MPQEPNINVPQKGLITDLHENLMGKELWSHARNAQVHSHNGQLQFVQNEPSNYKCIDLPMSPVGFIRLLSTRWAVFTTDGADSEIGVFDEAACSYETLLRSPELNFSTDHLISGVSKENFDCSETIYWTDAFNPRRFLNLQAIPRDPQGRFLIDETLVERAISVPTLSARLGSAGLLANGSYEFTIAYTQNDVRVTEFFTYSKPVQIFSHENRKRSIELELSGLDSSFDGFELVCIHTYGAAVTYRSVGFYPTSSTRVLVSNISLPSQVAVAPAELAAIRPRYTHADLICANDHYLLWGGVRTHTEVDYQAQAMKIRSRYLVYQVPGDYYKKGGTEVGYDRDEVYAFGIQWLHVTGAWSPVYHIPGRPAEDADTQAASGRDMYEKDKEDVLCSTEEIVPRWRVENTAGAEERFKGERFCDGVVVAEGDMAYWESTERYGADKTLYGAYAGTPIRHHRFPDNTISHIYEAGGRSLNVLGIRFEGIEHPTDSAGKPRQDVVGYRIVRADRKGQRSVVAKGLATNVRSYREDREEVLYANYPFNDLRADSFLSQKQTYRKNRENDYAPLTEVKLDQFNFYSPNALFRNVAFGEEVTFLREESARVQGYFEEVYKHPKHKLLTEFDLYFAMIIGALDGYYATTGRKCVTVVKDNKLDIKLAPSALVAGNVPVTANPTGIAGVQNGKMEQACDDALNFTSTLSVDKKQLKPTERVLRSLASAGVFTYFATQTAMKVLDIISSIMAWQQYALQYNAKGTFNDSRPVERDYRRRYLDHYQYIYDGINTVDGTTFNNYKRENSVYLKVSDEIKPPATVDNTRQTLSEFGLESLSQRTESTASAYYTAVKRRIPNQYGQLPSLIYMACGNPVTTLHAEDASGTYTTPPVFGGDTYIVKLAVKRSHHFFSQYLHEVPDGYIYDYRTFRNVAYPRYWIDSTPFELHDAVSLRPNKSRTPKNRHNLDGKEDSGKGFSVVRNKYFYLFNSGVMEFYVESDLNIENRDWTMNQPSFYCDQSGDLSTLFRSDNITKFDEYICDEAYSAQTRDDFNLPQSDEFDSSVAESCHTYLKNRVIYSQPANKDQKADAWMSYLMANYYDFPMAKFGGLTSMHPVDNQRIMFLFDKASPYVTVGRDQLQLDGSGRKITVGDGGLFAQEPQPVMHTDYHFGNAQGRHAFNNTHFGTFYPSQRQGRVFVFGQGLQEITQSGMGAWFKNYLPSRLVEDFPLYRLSDNPIHGVGLTSVFDNRSETYYLSKKDYKLKDEYKDIITYDHLTNTFKMGNTSVTFPDPLYFEEASWTISYNPAQKIFVSWHDWHPDYLLQSEKNFLSVKDSAVWKHGEFTGSYCNFYGRDYPFEIEYVVNNGMNPEVLRSIEYFLETGKYFNDGQDFHQTLDDNFDYMMVSNNEQHSGLLHLNLQDKRNLSTFFNYPKYNHGEERMEILFNKEEQRYRVNQFADLTRDRGEFTKRNFPLWVTAANGYERNLNPVAIDYQKPQQHRKKFRSIWHKILLRRLVCGDKKFLFKFAHNKQTPSPR